MAFNRVYNATRWVLNMIFGLAEQVNQCQRLDAWFHTPQGEAVAQAFLQALQPFFQHVSGHQLLQLGHCGRNIWLPELQFSEKRMIAPYTENPQKVALVGSLQALPLARNSMDCVLLPFTLDLFSHKKSPLDEVDRVLKPMGYAVFFGVNPISLWGAVLRFSRLLPDRLHAASLRSVWTLRNAMLARGYQHCFLSTFYATPPVEKPILIQKLAFLNEMTKMLSVLPTGFYCLIVQKYQLSVLPPEWKAGCRDFQFAYAQDH